MNDAKRIEMMIKRTAKHLFVHEDVDLTKANVIAAITAAAREMSTVADPEIHANKENVKIKLLKNIHSHILVQVIIGLYVLCLQARKVT